MGLVAILWHYHASFMQLILDRKNRQKITVGE